MEQFWNFLNPAGFLITAIGLFYGYLSFKSSKETNQMIEESRNQLNRSIEESRNQLNRSIEESRNQLNRSIEESRRSTQDILTAWHSRWEQSDEFNKRLLERILDKVH
ncbi:MAG: hypothetical protein L6Q54_08165 [Leptospiraceae bacterium]|nr:hypothetical protein [Leptospiraceae bacterium]MCK6381209.1 hypothetical protein [Leptospiraceae bacterium]